MTVEQCVGMITIAKILHVVAKTRILCKLQFILLVRLLGLHIYYSLPLNIF